MYAIIKRDSKISCYSTCKENFYNRSLFFELKDVIREFSWNTNIRICKGSFFTENAIPGVVINYFSFGKIIKETSVTYIKKFYLGDRYLVVNLSFGDDEILHSLTGYGDKERLFYLRKKYREHIINKINL